MNSLIEQFQDNINLNKQSIAQVYMWGSAECDQFDLKDSTGEEQPECKRPYLITQISLNITIIRIACGGLHTVFLSDQGQVYTSGCNDVHALGKSDDSTSDRIPCLVDLPVRVNMISAGDSHSAAVNSLESLVYFWGVYKNTNGNMQNPQQKPTRIGAEVFNKPITKLLSGYNHTIVLMDKKVYLWGDSDTKVLGRKSITRQCIQQSLRPEALGIHNIQDVFTGGYHSFVKVQRKIENQYQYCYLGWGLNNYGQLGIGSTDDALIPQEITQFRGKNITQIVGGEHHTLALENNGDVYSFGRNDDGQIGLGVLTNEELKQEAQIKRTMQLDELREKSKRIQSQKKFQQKLLKDIELIETNTTVIGYEYVTQPRQVEQLKNIQEVIAAGHYSYAVSYASQKFWSWGMGYSFVLGNREEDSLYEPFEIPQNFFMNEKVQQISIGGQHVAYIAAKDEQYELPSINPDILKVDELLKLPKIKSFRKQLPLREDNSKSNQSSKELSLKGRKKRDIIYNDGPIPESKIKID